MHLPALARRSALASLLALAACSSPPPPYALTDSARYPEPVRPVADETPRAPVRTGLALALSRGATELFVIDAGRAELGNPQGTLGEADADSAATLARVREAVAGLRIWAEDGVVVVDGEPPLHGRARSQTRAGVLRFSLTPHGGGGSAEGALTAEVRGDEITGRVWLRSAAGEARPWMHSAFFRAPLRRAGTREWPPRPPRTLSAERIPGGGVLLRWTVARHAAPDVEYVVYRAGAGGEPPVRVGATREMYFVAEADGGSASWYVVTRSAGGRESSPSPAAALP
jgi:hypothetical protein